MSDTKIGVEFSATTAAAVAEVDKLSAAVRESTTAARGAGKEQQALGREVNAARAAQIEATEATRKAKDAQQIHTLTVAKFGAASAEAAASEAKLTKATADATRAATVAAQSLDKTAKSAQAAAAAEDGNLTPATKRAAAQLERMAKDAERTGNDLHKLALQSKAPAGGFDLMGMASGKLMSVLGPAALGGTLMALGSWLGEASEKTLQYETALANLPFALEGAQAATRGLMSESKLAAAASSALALGVVKTDAEFSQLASDAAKIALKLGVSTDQMLGDLTTALGRGSAMILDNAGIILKVSDANEAYAASIGKTVSQLDEAEKKIAFQTAAMAAIRASADATTVAYESNAASIARLKVSAGDAWEAIERASVNAVGAVTSTAMTFNDDLAAMSASVDLLNRSMMQREEWSQGFKDLSVSAGETAIELLGMSEVAANFQRVLSDPESYKQAEAALDVERQKAAILTEEAKQAERIEKAMAKIATDNEAFLQAQTEADLFIGPMPAPEKKKRSGGKKKPTNMDLINKIEIRHDESDLVTDMYEEDFDREEAQRDKLHDLKLAGLDQDLEILDATGLAEEEAQARREAILTRRLDAEQEFARQQMRFARTDAQREAATTRMESVEHQKRIAALRKMAAAEEADQARKVAMTEKITGKITDLGGVMVQAAWDAAEGQKGAGLMALGEYLKTVSKQMAIKALVETALGVASLAGVVTAPLAAGHFAAAGIAAAVAVAAGGAGVGLANAGAARAEEGKGRPEGDTAAAGGTGVGGAAANGPGGATPEKRDLSAQEVPISYFDPSRMPASGSTMPAININFAGATFIGAGGPEKAAQEILTTLRRGKAAGAR